MKSDIKKYFTDKEHLKKRTYERFGNYLNYIKRPKRIWWRIISKRYGEIIARTYEINQLHELVKDNEGYGKYRNFSRYFYINFRRVFELGLHKSNSLNVLDIGCGGGFFLYIVRMFGHKPHGIDLDSYELFNRMIKYFNIPRLNHKILPQQPIPALGQQFDLITAYAICFHKMKTGSWNKEDWDYFLNDIGNNFIKKGGRLHLFFNDHPHGDFNEILGYISQSNHNIKVGHKALEVFF
jgi:SAM-dependent methyltransferase